MNKNQLEYQMGATFSGTPFWIGLILIASSIIGILSSEYLLVKIILALLIPVGVIFLLSFKRAAISLNEKKFEEYYNLIFFRLTEKALSINDYDSAELRLYSDIETFQKIPQSTTVRTKVYEVYLINDSSKDLIFESTDYKIASRLLDDLSIRFNLETINSYKLWQQEILRKRKNTRHSAKHVKI